MLLSCQDLLLTLWEADVIISIDDSSMFQSQFNIALKTQPDLFSDLLTFFIIWLLFFFFTWFLLEVHDIFWLAYSFITIIPTSLQRRVHKWAAAGFLHKAVVFWCSVHVCGDFVQLFKSYLAFSATLKTRSCSLSNCLTQKTKNHFLPFFGHIILNGKPLAS